MVANVLEAISSLISREYGLCSLESTARRSNLRETPYRNSDEWKRVAMELHRSKKLPKFIVLVKLESQR